jgi:hypothetical protein
MDFAQTNGLSMIGNDDFVTEEQLNGYVTLDTAQTITGDKTLSGTTTITGGITANAVNITPAELGFIGGLTSDAQTQLNGKVSKTGTETIDGDKTFTGTTVVAKTNATTNIQFANIPNYSFIDLCSGGNQDYDVRLSSLNGSATVGLGTFTIEAGSNNLVAYGSGSAGFNKIETTGGSGSYNQLLSHQNYLDATSDNIFRVGGTPRITTSGSLTTLSNTAHTINGVTTFDVNPLSATVPTTANELVNKTYADGKVSKTVADTISAIKTFSVLPESSVVPTTNTQLANKKYVDDTIVAGAFVTLGAPSQTITSDKLFTGRFQVDNALQNEFLVSRNGLGFRVVAGGSAGAPTGINLTTTFGKVTLNSSSGGIELKSTGGGNLIENTTGTNIMTTAATSSASNKIENTGTGGNFITTQSGSNQLFSNTGKNILNANTSSNEIQVNGTPRITTTSSTNTLSNGTNFINSTTGDTTINAPSGFVTDIRLNNISRLRVGDSPILNAASGGTTSLRVNSDDIMVISSTGVVMYKVTNFISYASARINIEIGADTVGTQSFIDFHSNTTNNTDYDARLISASTGSGSNGQSQLTADCVRFVTPQYSVGSSGSNNPLLSFQIHAVKQGTATAASVLFGPCYDFTGNVNETAWYCVPCNVRFMRATLMFDKDTSSTGTMNLDFYRKTSNAGSPGLVHSMGVAYTTNGSTSYSQQFDINTGSALTYNIGELIAVDYSGSPGNEWGIVFHGFQY